MEAESALFETTVVAESIKRARELKRYCHPVEKDPDKVWQ
jgi:hypothetical protein